MVAYYHGNRVTIYQGNRRLHFQSAAGRMYYMDMYIGITDDEDCTKYSHEGMTTYKACDKMEVGMHYISYFPGIFRYNRSRLSVKIVLTNV